MSNPPGGPPHGRDPNIINPDDLPITPEEREEFTSKVRAKITHPPEPFALDRGKFLEAMGIDMPDPDMQFIVGTRAESYYRPSPGVEVICMDTSGATSAMVYTRTYFDKQLDKIVRDQYATYADGTEFFISAETYVRRDADESLLLSPAEDNPDITAEGVALEEATGGFIFTHGRYIQVMRILEQCGPHNAFEVEP